MDSMPSKKKFILKFEKCKKYISNKEVERVVISEQFHFQTQKSPEILFQKLKKLNPSKYLFLCNFDNFYLIGSSPETMVKIINNKKVILSPLAGSKIRVKNQKQNNHNIKKFLHDKKEMREHFTVLKICRKDLEKLTITGSIKINKPEVKIFSHIMHLSSNLQGLLDPKYNVFDVIKFVFPSPALSGVPKSKAIKIISQLENVKRGPYSGILFTMGFNGFLDSCIIIRTIILDNKIATIQTGAGIGMYSKPDLEYEELCNKAKALISII